LPNKISIFLPIKTSIFCQTKLAFRFTLLYFKFQSPNHFDPKTHFFIELEFCLQFQNRKNQNIFTPFDHCELLGRTKKLRLYKYLHFLCAKEMRNCTRNWSVSFVLYFWVRIIEHWLEIVDFNLGFFAKLKFLESFLSNLNFKKRSAGALLFATLKIASII
jgi:hypothetical protein